MLIREKKIVIEIDWKMEGEKKKERKELRFLKMLSLERNREIKILF